MAKIFPYKYLVKQLQSTTPNMGGDSFVEAATQGAVEATEVVESVAEKTKETVDTAWDAAKKTAELVTETTMAEADTNVMDTVEYRCSEDLKGQLGDGHDSYS